MRLDRSHLMSNLMTGAAVVVCVAAIHSLLLDLHWPQSIEVAVAACVACIVALGAMRRPWFFLAIILVLWAVVPKVSDSFIHDIYEGGYQLAWLIGGPAGWIVRRVRRPGLSESTAQGSQPA